jgi:hypothetical protein
MREDAAMRHNAALPAVHDDLALERVDHVTLDLEPPGLGEKASNAMQVLIAREDQQLHWAALDSSMPKC